jgi:site-specific DNA recombinase
MQVEGYSIDEQIERLEKYCDANSWVIYNKYIDPGYSGSNVDRPAMRDMIRDIRNKKIDLVLVYKLDRLSRSQKDTLYLIEEEFLPNGVDFISMTENFDTSSPFGRAMIGILSVFAQLERENIKTRLLMGHMGRAKAGYWRAGSNPPIGYDYIDGVLKINEYEALQVRLIYKMFLEGNSIHGITKYMHEHYTNRYSSYGDSANTGVILRNSLYIGKIKYRGEEYDGVHEPIIDMDTWERVQRRYKEISSKWGEAQRSPYHAKHLLTGVIYCGNCGARYFAYSTQSKRKNVDPAKCQRPRAIKKYTYYKCYTREGHKTMRKADYCKNPNLRVDLLDEVILGEIKKLKLDPSYLKTVIASEKKVEIVDNELSVLRRRLETVQEQIDKLMDLYTIGVIPIQDIGDRVKPLYEEKTKLETNILNRELETKEPDVLTEVETRDILDSYSDAIDEIDHDTKRELVQSLIRRVEVMPDETIKIYWKFV